MIDPVCLSYGLPRYIASGSGIIYSERRDTRLVGKGPVCGLWLVPISTYEGTQLPIAMVNAELEKARAAYPLPEVEGHPV